MYLECICVNKIKYVSIPYLYSRHEPFPYRALYEAILHFLVGLLDVVAGQWLIPSVITEYSKTLKVYVVGPLIHSVSDFG